MKIRIASTEKLAAALEAEQGRAKTRTITVEDIQHAAAEVESRLDIPRTKMAGVQADVDIHADIYPRAYKYRPESTQFTLTWTASGCFATHISRCTTGGTRKQYAVRLTDDARAAILAAHERF